MPPVSLTILTQTSYPGLPAVPGSLKRPVNGSEAPRRIGGPAGAALRYVVISRNRITIPAISRCHRLMPSPSPLICLRLACVNSSPASATRRAPLELARRHHDFQRRSFAIQLRLRLARRRQWSGRRVVARPGDEQLLGRAARNYLAPILRYHQLLLDACGGPAVGGGPEGFQGKDHVLFDYLGIIEGLDEADDRLLPNREPHAVPVLQGERRLFIDKAELLRLRPDLH